VRDCYKKFWNLQLVEGMRRELPQFTLRESRAAGAGEAKPRTKPVIFFWKPMQKLTFSIEFRVPGRQDDFEAWFYWSEQGKVGANGTPALPNPFAPDVEKLPSAAAMIQTLSAHDGVGIYQWELWSPGVRLDATEEGQAAWKNAFIAEELRHVSDTEALERVRTAVDKALRDIRRCALPWFEQKLGWYLKNVYRP
jgi:hypothetical protein